MTVSLLIELGFSLFDAILCVYFISRFNEVSMSPKKNKLVVPAILVIFAFSIINDLLLAGFNVLSTIIFFALYVAYALLVSKKNHIKGLISACVFEISFVLLSSLLYLIITSLINNYEQLAQESESIFRYVYLVMHKLAIFVILKLILKAVKTKDAKEAWHGVVACIFSVATILGLGATMHMASRLDPKEAQAQTLIITFVFIFSNVILYFLIYQTQKHQKTKYEIKLLEEKIEIDQARIDEATRMWEGIRKVRHDMKHHMAVISGYLDSGEYEKCKEYIEKLEPSIAESKKLVVSDNAIIDYLINTKLSVLEDTQIVVSGSLGDMSDIESSDLACLIGNILDNAVEALALIQKNKEKRIELLFMRQNSNRIIICKNTIQKSVLAENSELVTTKTPSDKHGFGIKIIKKIVSDHGGMIEYFEDLDMFGVQIILPEALSK